MSKLCNPGGLGRRGGCDGEGLLGGGCGLKLMDGAGLVGNGRWGLAVVKMFEFRVVKKLLGDCVGFGLSGLKLNLLGDCVG